MTTETINQRIDPEGSVNETVCPGCNHDAAIRPLAEDRTCRWKVGEDEIGPKYCGHKCGSESAKQDRPTGGVCANCRKDISLESDGTWVHNGTRISMCASLRSEHTWAIPAKEGHVCTFSEPAKTRFTDAEVEQHQSRCVYCGKSVCRGHR